MRLIRRGLLWIKSECLISTLVLFNTRCHSRAIEEVCNQSLSLLMAIVAPHEFFSIFGLSFQELPLYPAFFDNGKEISKDRIINKGFIIDQINDDGDMLILTNFEFQPFFGIMTEEHDPSPIPFLRVESLEHLYSLLVLYGRHKVLCN